jgi:hypothetical protein
MTDLTSHELNNAFKEMIRELSQEILINFWQENIYYIHYKSQSIFLRFD